MQYNHQLSGHQKRFLIVGFSLHKLVATTVPMLGRSGHGSGYNVGEAIKK